MSSGLANAAIKRARRANPALYEAELASRRTPAAREKRNISDRIRRIQRRFVGIDGEGGNVNSRHEYLLLRAGNHTLTTGEPLDTDTCLDFIANLPTNKVCYVGYYFDYDVTMIVRGMTESKLHRLVDRETRVRTDGKRTWYLPVDYHGFQVEYIPRKEFRVRRTLLDQSHTPWVTISDVGSFFQCAFVKALEEWGVGTPEQRAAIAEGKDKRADFGQLTVETDEYNALEIDLLEQLMNAFRQVTIEVGYPPSRWQGPGYMATAMLRKHGVPTRRELTVPTEVVELATAAYYGGRFETTALGPVPGGAYQYDINSAYPHAMRSLPCLLHGRWEDVTTTTREVSPWTVAHGTFTPKEYANLYGFPVRNKQGSICYPASGKGTYWAADITAAIHQHFAPDKVWTYKVGCDCQPFEWIEPIYEERVKLGKSARGRVLKLGLNSLYGKTAQSVGGAPYANPIYAGLITATTRATLSGAAHTTEPGCCSDVFMLATDALFTGSPRDLPLRKSLGAWDDERHSELFIVQPGLYFTEANTQPKTRGIPRQAAVESRDAFRAAYSMLIVSGDTRRATVPISLHQFTGIRIAAARHKLSSAGEWVDVVKEVSYGWSTKRHPNLVAFQEPGPCIRTRPQDGDTEVESVAYSKDIGRLLEAARLDLSDQPDWADTLGEEV